VDLELVMPHVRKLPSGRFEARYRGGDGREHSRRFATRREARAFLDQVGVQQRAGEWLDPAAGRIKLVDWVDRWRATAIDLRPSSLARDEAYLRTHVLPAFGGTPIGKITPLDVRQWVAELARSGKAPATVHKAYQTLSKVLAAAVDSGLLARSPCQRIPLPKIEQDEMRFCTPEEVHALAAAIDPRFRALILFDASCGLRLSELAGLQRQHLDLGRRVVRIVLNAVEVRGDIVWGAPKTRAGRRVVPIPASVADVLADHVDEFVRSEPDAPVFPGRYGGVLRAGAWRNRFFYPAVERAGIDRLRPHDLRHTAVALWIAAGANPKQIARWAGHTSVSVVLDRYGHLYQGHEGAVLTQLDRLLRTPGLPEGDVATRSKSSVIDTTATERR
jgi:integrase